MSGTINKAVSEQTKNVNLINQACVRSVRNSDLPVILKAETEKFIERNTLPDCGRVPPNCLKAFMVRTAQKMGLPQLIPNLKSLFRGRVGYKGYFLDGGKLFRVELSDDMREFA